MVGKRKMSYSIILPKVQVILNCGCFFFMMQFTYGCSRSNIPRNQCCPLYGGRGLTGNCDPEAYDDVELNKVRCGTQSGKTASTRPPTKSPADLKFTIQAILLTNA